MGWSWALHVRHMLLVKFIVLAVVDVVDMFVLDVRPAPTVSNGRPALGQYVDNGNILTATPAEGSRIVRALFTSLTVMGFSFDSSVTLWPLGTLLACVLMLNRNWYTIKQAALGRSEAVSSHYFSRVNALLEFLRCLLGILSSVSCARAMPCSSCKMGTDLFKGR